VTEIEALYFTKFQLDVHGARSARTLLTSSSSLCAESSRLVMPLSWRWMPVLCKTWALLPSNEQPGSVEDTRIVWESGDFPFHPEWVLEAITSFLNVFPLLNAPMQADFIHSLTLRPL
jgi:hypothetical protein